MPSLSLIVDWKEEHMKTLFIGSLPNEASEEDVNELFSEFGTVRKLDLPRDIFSGRNKGFAKIDMEGHEARAAMAALDGKTYKGNTLKVREEKPRHKGSRRR
jgi:RNA recognition motif-containing protein